MSVKAKMVKFKRQLERIEKAKREPEKAKIPARERIRIRLRCRLCGRPRAVSATMVGRHMAARPTYP